MKKLMVFLCLGFFCFCATTARSEETQNNKFLVLTIDNKIISPVIANYVLSGIDLAEKDHYSGVIILLDTPGGLLESTRAIVKKIMNTSVPVITYIAPSGSRAGSAGVFITLASDIAVMAPSTNIGAAHPIMIGAEKSTEPFLKKAKNLSGNPMEEKVLNDTVAWITTIAKNRNRNAEWAKDAVTKSISTTEKEALEKKIVNLVAKNMDELLAGLDNATFTFPDKTFQLHTKKAQLVYFNLPLRQQILSTLIEPNIAYILMLIGFLGLFIEITHPGVILPGIVGIISLVVAFYAFAMLPVHFAGFLLIALAIIFFITEAVTAFSFGLLTIAGAISMILGSLMLIDSSFSGMRISLTVILPFVLAVGTVVIFLSTNVIRAHRKKITTGSEALIGQTGVAQTDIGEEGQVFVGGEIWSAINKTSDPIKKGEKIKVIGVDKVKLIVGKC